MKINSGETVKKNSKIYKLLVAAFIVVCGVTALYRADWMGGSNSKINWERVSPLGTRFAISFPSSPEQLEKQLPVPNGRPLNYQELVAEVRGANYSVSYLDFPRKWKLIGNHTLLRKSLEMLMIHEGQNRQLLSQHSVTHRGYPALDYITKEGNRLIHGRLVIVGNTLFKINVNHPEDSDAAQESFVASFDPVVRP
jgi:hypothetical protein